MTFIGRKLRDAANVPSLYMGTLTEITTISPKMNNRFHSKCLS